MPERAHLRMRHLRRLTDRVGVLSRGEYDGPDRFAGYDTVDNGLALRLATRLFGLGVHDDASAWASIYLQFLLQAYRSREGFSAHREALGTWSPNVLPPRDLAEVARGLAVASNSDLPAIARGRADTLWNNTLPDFSAIRCPRAAATWLIAIGERPPAEQRKIEDVADRLATWIVEDCYYAVRAGDWEWFDDRVLSGDACVPHGLWAAHAILGEQRYARVAAVMTGFWMEHLFDEDRFMPVGTRNGWPRHGNKAVFDQLPLDIMRTVELLACAYDITGSGEYAERAACAHRWFTGNNVGNVCMLDDTTDGVYDVLTAEGHGPGQGATALVSFLLSAVAVRSVHSTRVAHAKTVLRAT